MIYKSLNLSNNGMTNCEVDDIFNKGNNKIFTPWVVPSKGHPLFRRKQSKVD